jgi:hypothetical protein
MGKPVERVVQGVDRREDPTRRRHATTAEEDTDNELDRGERLGVDALVAVGHQDLDIAVGMPALGREDSFCRIDDPITSSESSARAFASSHTRDQSGSW